MPSPLLGTRILDSSIHIPRAEIGSRRVSVGTDSRRVSAGTGSRRVSAGTDSRRVSSDTGSRLASAGTGARRASALVRRLCEGGSAHQLAWLEAYLTDEARDRTMDGEGIARRRRGGCGHCLPATSRRVGGNVRCPDERVYHHRLSDRDVSTALAVARTRAT